MRRVGALPVAEYKYNGLGYRISIHEDTDTDGDVDASDKWFHHAYDERWRWVATFREDDSDPKEEYLHHAAGLDGDGTGSYIDLVIYRDRDINSGWTSAADGTLEERIYYCQNWRADVSALVTDGGQMLEWVKYSAYGVPFGLPGGDADSDGDCDASDVSQVGTWVSSGPYDVRGDIDLDGDVDGDDSSTISSDYNGITLGREVLSDDGVGNRRGVCGHVLQANQGLWDGRRRLLSSVSGYWLTRDALKYIDGRQLYCYGRSAPLKHCDPHGLLSVVTGFPGSSGIPGLDGVTANSESCRAGVPEWSSIPNGGEAAPGGLTWRLRIGGSCAGAAYGGACHSGHCALACAGVGFTPEYACGSGWETVHCENAQSPDDLDNQLYKEWHGVDCEQFRGDDDVVTSPMWEGDHLKGDPIGSSQKYLNDWQELVNCPGEKINTWEVTLPNGWSLTVSLSFTCGCSE